jgi:SOS-response transcriptional repressor LexA
MENLTAKQRAILDYIFEFDKINHYQPNLQEIADYFKIIKPTVDQHLHACQNKGYITVTGQARAIKFEDKYFKEIKNEKRN